MKWIPKDIEILLKSKEYVDTAVIPLVQIGFGEDMKQSSAMSEFITLLVNHLERQFTGRILLFPPFTYLKTDNEEKWVNDLQKWTENIKMCDFRHIFYITCDSDWKANEGKMDAELLWMPALPLENMEESQKMAMIDSQVKQILNLFMKKWR
ncbi:MAG TPA: YpiF family protein [Bacillales bacterium]|nr:YpiF family protein [Bacillales bacterium]